MSVLAGIGRGGAGRTGLAATILAGLTLFALAQAGDPDYFRITGIKEDDNLNVRQAPNADAKIVGKIKKNADGVKNLGCNRGDLTEKQWDKAKAAQKKDALRRRWCEVEFNGVKGWASARFLAEGSGPKMEPPKPQAAQPAPQMQPAPPPSIAPSFDCTKAEKNWEKLVCADSELAAVDREAARLYALASSVLNATPGYEPLLTAQNRWRGQIVTCFDRECVSEMLVRRVHMLRRDVRETRAEDAKGISMGPLVARCEGLPIPVAVTYVNSDPGFAYLEWMDGFVVMPHVPAGSGALYEGSFARFHTKGSAALLLVPGGKAEMNCKLEKAG